MNILSGIFNSIIFYFCKKYIFNLILFLAAKKKKVYLGERFKDGQYSVI